MYKTWIVLGTTVGNFDGLEEGLVEGMVVGDDVGVWDGFVEGIWVGGIVGENVGEQPQMIDWCFWHVTRSGIKNQNQPKDD